jgi:hypothetical protein
MLLWNLALHPVLCRVMDRHPGVLAICFVDNVILLGLASDVLAAQHDLEAQLCRDLSATPNLKESYLYAPAWTADGLTMGTIPEAFRNMAARNTAVIGSTTSANNVASTMASSAWKIRLLNTLRSCFKMLIEAVSERRLHKSSTSL